jgi:membrane protease YdiL (CAAX protease family)
MGQPVLVELIWALAAGLSIRFFWRKASGLAGSGGKVAVGAFGLEDLIAAVALMGWMIAMSSRGWSREHSALSVDDLIGGTIFMVVVAVGTVVFLQVRKRSGAQMFGATLRAVPGAALVGLGGGLACLPLVLGVGWIVRTVMGPETAPQEVVQFYVESARIGDSRAVLAVWILGGIVAPVTEEILFRGYFYGAVKRFWGRWAAMLSSAVVFGVIHANLPALPALIVLAICLALAYEASGSLWTPIIMHAGFNLLMLAALWFSGGEIGL